MKTLNDIKQDMSSLYDEVKSGSTQLEVAAELANIAGKYLKAEQLQLARDIFLKGVQRHQPALQDNGSVAENNTVIEGALSEVMDDKRPQRSLGKKPSSNRRDSATA